MYIDRIQLEQIKSDLQPQKVVVIYGPRRTGKTTLIKKFLEKYPEPYLFVNGENIDQRVPLESQSIKTIKEFVGQNKLLVIDEAQKIDNVGLNLKLIVDSIDGIMVIATGSSSFDLAKNVGEPLTGRKYTLKLFPVSQIELSAYENNFEAKQNLGIRLIYGSYPEIFSLEENRLKERYLKETVSSYLYKDLLELDGIRHSKKIIELLQLLAFQIGHEVSYNELSLKLEIAKKTVERYLDLLEQAFVIFRVCGFSRNLRKEVTKNCRYYFYDNGVRNALINNFNPLNLRDDIGMLWENYIVMERIKKQEYKKIYSNNYFWRTYDQKEIDWIEEREGKLFGYEIKWGKKIPKAPKIWLDTYHEASWQAINQENYLDFIV